MGFEERERSLPLLSFSQIVVMKGCDEIKGEENPMSLLFEQPHFGELVEEFSVVLGNLRDRVVFEMKPSEELVHMLPSRAWMVSYESVCDVLTGKIEQWVLATRVVFGPI